MSYIRDIEIDTNRVEDAEEYINENTGESDSGEAGSGDSEEGEEEEYDTEEYDD